jgi:CubicO group peptidase (beta-lactamase class C family)
MDLHIETLHTYLSRIAPFGFAGAALVAHQGQILMREGYGLANRETGVAITAVTISNTGSISNQFTAAAIWELAMEG